MKVFLDMDGVLVDFNKAACAIVNAPYPPTKYEWIDLLNARQEIDECCTIDFWQNLKWKSDGARILDVVLAKFNISDIYLLTTPMPNPGSWTGKRLWVEDNTPAFVERLIVTQVPKRVFASPIIGTTLLIDDKDENIEGFVRAGGCGILVPRLWNRLRGLANNSLQVVKNSLEVL